MGKRGSEGLVFFFFSGVSVCGVSGGVGLLIVLGVCRRRPCPEKM